MALFAKLYELMLNNGGGGAFGPDGTMKCSECGEFATACVYELEKHVAGEHLEWAPYRCHYCHEGHYTAESALRKHQSKNHSGKEMLIVYKDDDVRMRQLLRIMHNSLTGVLGPLVDGSNSMNVSNPPLLYDSAQLDGMADGVDQEPIEADVSSPRHVSTPTTPQSPDAPSPVPDENDSVVGLEQENDDDAAINENLPDGTRCYMCMETLSKSSGFVRHIQRKHMVKKLFSCKRCDFKTNSIGDARAHATKEHQHVGDTLLIFDDHRDRHRDELDELYRNCFPDRSVTRMNKRVSNASERRRESAPVDGRMANRQTRSTIVPSSERKPGRPLKVSNLNEMGNPSKRVLSKLTFTCQLCPKEIRGTGGKTAYREHAALHLECKPFQCDKCKFHCSRQHKAREHERTKPGHHCIDRVNEVMPLWKHITVKCFPELKNAL